MVSAKTDVFTAIKQEGLEYVTFTLDEDGNYIGLCPGAQHFTKMWPEEYYIALGNTLNKMGYKVVLLGGSSDRLLCRMLPSDSTTPRCMTRPLRRDTTSPGRYLMLCSPPARHSWGNTIDPESI